jgi:two-component system NtrC family sensor kinase
MAVVKLVRKLAWALIAAMVAVLVVSAVLRVRREKSIFEGDVRRDHLVIGRALAAAITAVWAREGSEHAQQLIDSASTGEAGVSVRWRMLGPDEPAALDAIARRALRAGQIRDAIVREPGHDGPGHDHFVTFVPVPSPQPGGAIASVLEVSESLVPLAQYERESIIVSAGTTLGVAAACGVMAALIGVWLVGGPVGKLAAHARRIGQGDLNARLTGMAADELGALGSEMNEMAGKLADARGALAEEAAARVAALEQLRQADRLRTVGRLASGIAHELGTPLAVVAGRAQMIADRETSPDETIQNARIIVEQSDRMTKIIRQLLDFARHRQPERTTQEIAPILEQSGAMLGPLADKARVRIVLDPVATSVRAPVDAMQLQQVMTNLLVNAIAAMPDGGEVHVRAAVRSASPPPESRASLPAAHEGQHVCIEVADQGTGIAPEDLPRVFEPFFTTKAVGEGTGLGLSVAYGIVREHGGFIEVESEKGRGATFRVCIPVADAADADRLG